MERRVAVLGLLVLAVGAPAPAGASPRQESIFMDDNRLLYRGPAVATATLRELKGLGVDRVRVSLHWRAIAPEHRSAQRPPGLTDPLDPAQYPAHHFDNHDHLLRQASRLGIGVLVNVTGGAPLWATGRRSGRPVSLQYRPSPRQFAQFVEMLGRRYSGRYRDENQRRRPLPRVRAWSIWNEPNHGALLQPQWVRRGGRWVAYSPGHYRRLVRAALRGLERSGHGADTVLLGETAPRGDDRRGPTRAIRPGLFLRALLCLDGRLQPMPAPRAAAYGCDFADRGPLAVTGYAHHPYSITSHPATPDPVVDDATLADRDRLAAWLDAGAAAGRVPARLPLWWTEYGWQTMPPDPVRGVRLADQAAWIVEAERITRADPRVAAHAQFLMYDDVPRRRVGRRHPRYWSTYQSGLRFADGRRKPAYAAYRLGLTAVAPTLPGRRPRLWGLVRAAPNGVAQRVRLEHRPAGAARFAPVGEPVAVRDPGGAFSVTPPPRGAGEWRFAWGRRPVLRSNAVRLP